jgi:hypothetical protein
MASVTFDRFDGGLLLARPSSVAPANSLRKLINMDVQPGGWLRSRPKWKPAAGGFTLGPQWKGLESNAGYLWTFSCWNVASPGAASAVVNLDTGDRIVYAFISSGVGGDFAQASRTRLMGVSRWNNGFLGVLTPDDGTTYFKAVFSLNTSTFVVTPTIVTDVNMPNSGIMVTAAGRIFSISDDGQVVRFCKVGDPADWTAAGNAGFLPVSQHFASGQRAYGLGLYQGKLAVFTDQSIQLWTIDPDPTAMALDRVVDGVGTRHHTSIVSLYGDLLFLSESGFRSLTTLSSALFPSDVDVGLPIKQFTKSPESLTRFSNGGLVPSVIALAAGPVSQYWCSAPGRWAEG